MSVSDFNIQELLVILCCIIGVFSEIVLVSDGCARLDEALTLRANYTDSVRIIAWRRADVVGEITLRMTGQTSCEHFDTEEYNLTKYTFRCNATQHEYSMKINQVEDGDINSNWTITVSSSNGREESNQLQITQCAPVTDEPQVTIQKEENGLSDTGKIGLGIGGVVGVLALSAVMLIFYRKRKKPNQWDRSNAPGCHYAVKITTGVKERDSSRSTAWINIIGDEGRETGEITLSDVDGNGFHPGTTKTFGLDAVAVGNIKSILLGCRSDSSTTSRWFVKEVEIEVPRKHIVFKFDCYIPNNGSGEQREVDTQNDAIDIYVETSKRPNSHLQPIVPSGQAGASNKSSDTDSESSISRKHVKPLLTTSTSSQIIDEEKPLGQSEKDPMEHL